MQETNYYYEFDERDNYPVDESEMTPEKESFWRNLRRRKLGKS